MCLAREITSVLILTSHRASGITYAARPDMFAVMHFIKRPREIRDLVPCNVPPRPQARTTGTDQFRICLVPLHENFAWHS